jgi:acetoin utilization protein AcuB
MNVSYVMTKDPLYIHPEMSVQEARALMKKEKVGRFPGHVRNELSPVKAQG